MRVHLRNAWQRFSFLQVAWVTLLAIIVPLIVFAIFVVPNSTQEVPAFLKFGATIGAVVFAVYYPLVAIMRFLCLLANKPRSILLYAFCALIGNPILLLNIFIAIEKHSLKGEGMLFALLGSVIGGGVFYWLDSRAEHAGQGEA